METTPQLNFEYVPPKWNVDKLEGAVLHCLQVCGPLSGAAINAFCQLTNETKNCPRITVQGPCFRGCCGQEKSFGFPKNFTP